MHIRSIGAWAGSRDLLFNVGTPLISQERFKLVTSDFVHICKAKSYKQRYAKYVTSGITWPTFKFQDALIHQEWLKLMTSNVIYIYKARGPK